MNPDAVKRLAGRDRVETALRVWEQTKSTTVILAGYNGVVDVVSAAPLAAAYGTSVVYALPDRLPEGIAAQIRAGKIKSVKIVGGTGVVSAAIEKQIRDLGAEVERFAAADRYGTALAIARAVIAKQQTTSAQTPVVFATGTNTVDALTAGPVAAKLGGVVLLTTRDGLTAQTQAYVKDLKAQTYIVGGTAKRELANTELVAHAKAYVGSDRYATAAAVFDQFFAKAQTAYLATGTRGPDAAAVGALAVKENTGVLLALPTELPTGTKQALKRVKQLYIVGSTGAISDSVAAAAGEVLAR